MDSPTPQPSNQTSREPSSTPPLFVWIPRILIAISILLLIYFTQRTYRFSGKYDESFLAPENLNLIRGPLANEEYYKRGSLDYKGADPLGEGGDEDPDAAETGHEEKSPHDDALGEPLEE